MTGYPSSSGSPIFIIFFLAVVAFLIVSYWKVYTKAGEPGWGALVPFYNLYLYCKIAGRPGWWWVLLMVPLVNIVVGIIVAIDFARAFGKSTGFGVGLWILSPVFVPILAFGPAKYTKPMPTRG